MRAAELAPSHRGEGAVRRWVVILSEAKNPSNSQSLHTRVRKAMGDLSWYQLALSSRRSTVACAMLLVGAPPAAQASQSATDTIVVHAVPSPGPLLKLLSGIARVAGGGFTQREAERINQDSRGLAASHKQNPLRQSQRSYDFRVGGRGETGRLSLTLVSTQWDLFDLRIETSNPAIAKAVRRQLGRSALDSVSAIGPLRLTLTENRLQFGKPDPGADPRIVLAVSTANQFGCLAHIDHELWLVRDTLYLDLHGATTPSDFCMDMMGPPNLSRELPLRNGRFPLLVSYRGNSDRLMLDISDTATMVTGLDSGVVEADERPRWRNPRNSFYLACSDRGGGFCDDVRRWLVRQPGISQASFPAGGINPYRPEDYATEGRIFYRYDKQPSFELLRQCFASIEDQIREAVGVSVGLETWRGEYINAYSRRANHERHIEPPGRVTETPACGIPPERRK